MGGSADRNKCLQPAYSPKLVEGGFSEVSLSSTSGDRPRPRSRALRHGRYRCLPKRSTVGRPAPPADRSVRPARRSLPRELGNGEPPNGAQTWLPPVRHEGHLRDGSVQPPRRVPLWRGCANGGAVPQVPSPASP